MVYRRLPYQHSTHDVLFPSLTLWIRHKYAAQYLAAAVNCKKTGPIVRPGAVVTVKLLPFMPGVTHDKLIHNSRKQHTAGPAAPHSFPEVVYLTLNTNWNAASGAPRRPTSNVSRLASPTFPGTQDKPYRCNIRVQ